MNKYGCPRRPRRRPGLSSLSPLGCPAGGPACMERTNLFVVFSHARGERRPYGGFALYCCPVWPVAVLLVVGRDVSSLCSGESRGRGTVFRSVNRSDDRFDAGVVLGLTCCSDLGPRGSVRRRRRAMEPVTSGTATTLGARSGERSRRAASCLVRQQLEPATLEEPYCCSG